MSDPFVLGVNYWPRKKAMYWWSQFDADEVKEEFDIIRSLGMSVVRIFLLWDDWQPTPDSVSSECMAHLAQVCDIAAERGLGLDVTFFTGHMSGPNWTPRWLRDETLTPPKPDMLVSGGQLVEGWYRNYYTDSVARSAQCLLVETVVKAFHNHPAIWMWNLGNEPDLFAIAPTVAEGDAWTREMTDLIKSIDPVHPVTLGLHSASIFGSKAHRINTTFNITDIAVMHSYPMYVHWLENPLDPDFVPFTCALTSALCGKPTLMEEFGGCTALPGQASHTIEWTSYGQPRTQFMASEEDLAAYLEAVLPRLVDVGATGAVMWCFADYVDELRDVPPVVGSRHEQYFGLVRPDGSLKPHAEVIRRFAQTNPTIQPAKRTVELTVSPDEYYQKPSEYLQEAYYRFVAGQ